MVVLGELSKVLDQPQAESLPPLHAVVLVAQGSRSKVLDQPVVLDQRSRHKRIIVLKNDLKARLRRSSPAFRCAALTPSPNISACAKAPPPMSTPARFTSVSSLLRRLLPLERWQPAQEAPPTPRRVCHAQRGRAPPRTAPRTPVSPSRRPPAADPAGGQLLISRRDREATQHPPLA
ncbi:unnamed protein product [Boreogadus saida]